MGNLYLVSTPIGNMEDMSERAINTLKEADLILAEDTRRSGKLLKHFGIDTPMSSFHEHNEESKIEESLKKLFLGQNLALISDAGTPTISDPGFKLVRECRIHKVKVIPIPGPSSVISALSASGLPTDSFSFLGYVPKKEAKRKNFYKKVALILEKVNATVVFFETPHRFNKVLDELYTEFPSSNLSIAREITKKNEEVLLGTVKELREKFKDKKVKGEITLVLH